MQKVERPNDLTFHKWDAVGSTVDVVITDAPVYDKPNSLGGKDNYFRAVVTGTEDRIQVPMPYDLKKKVQVIEESIVYGKTRLVIAFIATKPLPGRSALKVFDVQVEGLKDE